MVAQPSEHYHIINGNPDVTRPQGPQENEESQFKNLSGLKPNTESSHKPESGADVANHEREDGYWDGPIWCSRFGRFEKQEDAIADDAPDAGLYRCEKHQCACRSPFLHRSYMDDIKRSVEPLRENLLRLEQVVEKLVHQFVEKGENLALRHHIGHGHNGGPAAVEGTAERNSHGHHVPIEESLRRLEAHVKSLIEQVVKNDRNGSVVCDRCGKAGKADEGAYSQRGRQETSETTQIG